MSLIRKHIAVLQAWACLALVKFGVEQRWGRENWRFWTDKSSYLRNGER